MCESNKDRKEKQWERANMSIWKRAKYYNAKKKNVNLTLKKSMFEGKLQTSKHNVQLLHTVFVGL